MKSARIAPIITLLSLITLTLAVPLLSGCKKKGVGITPIAGTPSFAGVRSAFVEKSASAFGETLSLTGGFDEIWVIARSKYVQTEPATEQPGSGCLIIQREDQKNIPLPLKHTAVRATVNGYISSVSVTQQFQNPYDSKIEATYVFPLPENAAVNDFVMVIGERKIRGIIRERQEAEQIYQEARSAGHVASLLTQERPNVFTQSVANIEPGKQIDVTLQYFNTLAYHDGWYEFVFPMVVGPRFNPPGTSNGIGAVPRGHQNSSGQSVEVPYLTPEERSGHDISLQLDIQAGVTIEELLCRSHVVTTERSAPDRATVTLASTDTVPNKDFVLRFRVAGSRIKSNLITHEDQRGGFFTLMLYPPAGLEQLKRAPMEMVFVLDCSGSMNGKPIEQARSAIERGLQSLQPGDSFQIIDFNERASALGKKPIEATPHNIRRGLAYLKKLDGRGGTMMIEGIKAALDFPHDQERLRFVCFMTDGYIGNEADILKAVEAKLGASRIFSFGVGSSPNRYLLDSMAKIGRGAVAYLGHNDSGAEVMDHFFARISHPAMQDLSLDWGSMTVSDVYPRRIPDLFVGRPVVLTGRFEGTPSNVRVTGLAGGNRIQFTIPQSAREETGVAAIPSVWARMKIADLADQTLWDRDKRLPREIKQTALDFNLMSPYTAFIAVDSSRRTAGAEGTTVPVAVPVPEGVKYRTTVGE